MVLLRIEHSSFRILNTEQTLARLACVRHAASVHPEPGSNSHKKFVTLLRLLLSLKYLAWFVCGLNQVSFLTWFKRLINCHYVTFELTCCSIFKVHYVVFDDLFIVLFREISVKYFFQKIWCLEAESNHRHGDFQSPALPTELSRHKWWA